MQFLHVLDYKVCPILQELSQKRLSRICIIPEQIRISSILVQVIVQKTVSTCFMYGYSLKPTHVSSILVQVIVQKTRVLFYE